MAGPNRSIMLALAMGVSACLIEAGCLGLLVFEGLNSLKIGLAGIGGASIVLVDMVLDRVAQALGQIKKEEFGTYAKWVIVKPKEVFA